MRPQKPGGKLDITERLNTAIECLGLSIEEERLVKSKVRLLIPKIRKIIIEAVRAEKQKPRSFAE